MYKRAQLSLLEQMQISDVEIQNRLELVALKPVCMALLAKAGKLVEQHIGALVEEFYTIQLSIDEIAVLISDADTLYRLKLAQHQYILDLFSGCYDNVYVNNRLRIGMVHKRIGVEPKLYLSAISTLKRLLFELLQDLIADPKKLNATKIALDKLFYFDTTLVFDTYIAGLISEIELAQQKTQKYADSLEQKVAERTAQLEELTKLDSLTGIYNQRAMRELARQMLLSVKRRNSTFSLVYFDIDDFKKINDKYGHLKGDEVLKNIATVIENHIREVDIACRYGGDEFCIALPDADINAAKVVCERILHAFVNQYPDFSLSIGIAQTGPYQYLNEDELIALADKKMYRAKAKKGANIQI